MTIQVKRTHSLKKFKGFFDGEREQKTFDQYKKEKLMIAKTMLDFKKKEVVFNKEIKKIVKNMV